jgi:ribosomal protein L18
MATPINTFKTITASLTTTNEILYTAPAITSTIILMAQVTNITESTATVSASHYDDDSATETELIKNFTVPVADAVGILVGKLVLTQGQSFKASSDTNDSLKITLSLLETK